MYCFGKLLFSLYLINCFGFLPILFSRDLQIFQPKQSGPDCFKNPSMFRNLIDTVVFKVSLIVSCFLTTPTTHQIKHARYFLILQNPIISTSDGNTLT